MRRILYNALQEASIRAETYNGSVGLARFHSIVSEDSKRELEEIEKRELKSLKKRIIETHADRHQSVANIVDGNATFHSYGEPIIEQAKRVEDKYRDRNFGFAKKRDFLGMDARDVNDVQEAVQYLKREEIINPNKFFKSKLILPQSARKLIGKWNGLFDLDGRGNTRTYLGFLLATNVAGGYIGYQEYGPLGGIGGCLGGYGLAFAVTSFPLGLENATLDRISNQRISFENTLNSLDSEVREHFPLDPKLKIVGVA